MKTHNDIKVLLGIAISAGSLYLIYILLLYSLGWLAISLLAIGTVTGFYFANKTDGGHFFFVVIGLIGAMFFSSWLLVLAFTSGGLVLGVTALMIFIFLVVPACYNAFIK